MISLKKYLDMDAQELITADCAGDQLDPAVTECYRSALASMGKNASRVCPGLGIDLEANLRGVGRRLSVDATPKALDRTKSQVDVLLDEWGKRASEHFKGKADEVKELLIALAKAAESVGNRDQGYSHKFNSLIGNLERIADLEDVTEIRSSIVKRASELKQSVDQMARESQELVAGLRSEVSIYETRLRSAEHLIFKDELTLVANRRSIEERMRGNIESGQPFCVVMLDLNHFKQVNDRYGHLAGDDLLKQFARELQLNTRSADMVGRWGGDEFVLVLACDGAGAQLHIDRIHDWVFGRYLIQTGTSKKPVEVRLDASIGVADWHPGESIEEVIENADRAMYRDKQASRVKKA
jgi:diguanylate cyclase (GGDEF)-like protein